MGGLGQPIQGMHSTQEVGVLGYHRPHPGGQGLVGVLQHGKLTANGVEVGLQHPAIFGMHTGQYCSV